MLKMFGEAEYVFCQSGTWRYPLDDLAAAADVLLQSADLTREALQVIAEADALLKNQNAHNADIRRAVNTVRHLLLVETGQSPADWDFLDASSRLDPQKRLIFGGMRVYLEDVRSPFNVGSLFRTAESFGVEKMLLSPFTANPLHKRAERTAMGCVAVVDWERLPLADIPNGQVFALETGGTALADFQFPQAGVMLIGSEELGVSPAALKWADASLGRVSIPTYGAKGSLNVSAAFAIALQAWAAALLLSGKDRL
jgi:TrmH family RNA methyltransferase